MLRACSLVLMFSFPVWLSAADNNPERLLEQMTQAGQSISYQGIFSYHTGRSLQSVRIYHRSDSQGERERLIALNGAAREVIRNNDTVTCINPENNEISVSQRPLGKGFPTDLPRRLTAATAFYDLSFGKVARVAGRKAQQLFINPRDEYRYGYRLWVDKQTNLLMRSELMGSSGEVLETFAFSDLELDVTITDDLLEPSISGDEMVWLRSEASEALNEVQEASDWHANWLPEGFALVTVQNRLRTHNGAEVEQHVYSDGLSSVSIFIEKVDAHHHLHGNTNMGAINAFGTIQNAHFITVVGEVPPTTVNKIGAGIRYTGQVGS